MYRRISFAGFLLGLCVTDKLCLYFGGFQVYAGAFELIIGAAIFTWVCEEDV